MTVETSPRDERAPSPSQILFREVNDQIRKLADRWGRRGDLEVLCECQNGCFEHLRIPLEEYESVRSHPSRFVARPGHEAPEIERVIRSTAAYVVVEKVGDAGPKVIPLDRRHVDGDGDGR